MPRIANQASYSQEVLSGTKAAFLGNAVGYYVHSMNLYLAEKVYPELSVLASPDLRCNAPNVHKASLVASRGKCRGVTKHQHIVPLPKWV